MAVCKRRPNKAVLTAKIAACLSRTDKYKCPTTVTTDSLKELVGDCSNCFAIRFDRSHELNQMSIQLQSASGEAEHLSIRVLSDSNETQQSRVRIAAQGLQENVPIASVDGDTVVIQHDEGRVLPPISSLSFAMSTHVKPLPIAKCSGPVPGCESLYDGVKTSWQPNNAVGSVKFTFGDREEGFGSPRTLNQLHIRYTAHIKHQSTKQMEIRIECDSGVEEKLDLMLKNGLNDLTVTLKTQKTKNAIFKYSIGDDPKVVEFNEVMFWHSEESTQRTKSATKKTNALVQSSAGAMTRVTFFNEIANAAKYVAMGVCLAALQVGQWVLGFAKFVVNAISSIAIAILEGLIALMGPKFFKIINFMVEGGMGDLAAGGNIFFGMNIHMYLFGCEIGPWGFRAEFSVMSIINALMGNKDKGVKKGVKDLPDKQ